MWIHTYTNNVKQTHVPLKNFNLKSKMSSNTNEMQITENAFTKNWL